MLNTNTNYAYKEINGALIYKITREIKGAAGPSNLDANWWRRILTSLSLGNNSRHLCNAVGLMAKKLCLKRYCGIDGSLEAFLACKLIPLRQESWGNTYRDWRRYKENFRSCSYESLQKKHPRKCRWFATLYRSTCGMGGSCTRFRLDLQWRW